MMTSRAMRAREERRGIVLVLVLAMLGLLALVAVTFATYAGQSKITNRIFMQSLFQPQADELIDFGLAQLITDTNDIRSAIRGHSLARDMYGNDATGNAILSYSPTTGLQFQITGVTATTTLNQYILTTNIQTNDSNFYGYNFTRWIMRVGYTGNRTYNGTLVVSQTAMVNQTFEILNDDATQTYRQFTVFINAGINGVNPVDVATALYNPTAFNGYGSFDSASGSLHDGGGCGHHHAGGEFDGIAVQCGRPLAARVQRPGRQRVDDVVGDDSASSNSQHDDGVAGLLLWELPLHRPLCGGSLRLARPHRRDGEQRAGFRAVSRDRRDGRGLRRLRPGKLVHRRSEC